MVSQRGLTRLAPSTPVVATAGPAWVSADEFATAACRSPRRGADRHMSRADGHGFDAGAHDAATSAGPLIVSGMHRSGASVVAAIVANAGIRLGSDLRLGTARRRRTVPADRGFQDFHLAAVVAHGIVPEGFTTQAALSVPEPLRRQAARLVEARRACGQAWGWVDPRSSLLLDFWRTEVPDARFLLVFRRPWEVVASLYRDGGDVFRDNPALALDVWLNYNRLIVEFASRNPRITIVCETRQAAADPLGLCRAIRGRFGLALCDPSEQAVPHAFPRDDDDAGRPALLQALCPEAIDLYRQLQDLAGTPAPLPNGSVPSSGQHDLWRHLVAEWQRSAVATSDARARSRTWPTGLRWWPGRDRRAA